MARAIEQLQSIPEAVLRRTQAGGAIQVGVCFSKSSSRHIEFRLKLNLSTARFLTIMKTPSLKNLSIMIIKMPIQMSPIMF